MPTSSPVRVVACHIRSPLRVYGRVVYRLLTADGGDFVSANPPEFFNATGQPVVLTAELATGSVVRVEHDGRGAMAAVQLIAPLYQNPFARLMQFMATLRSAIHENRCLPCR